MGPAAVQIPQGSPAVVSAYPQRVQPESQRPAVRGQSRRGAGALVTRATQHAVVGHDHSGTRWPFLRQFRCRRWGLTAARGGPGGRCGCRGRSVGHDRHHRWPSGRCRQSEAFGSQAAEAAAVGAEKSRRQKGSASRDKSRRKVAVAHNKVARARRDYHHKQALALVRENQVIHVEDLNIVGMVRNRRLARAISDAGWGQFVRIIDEKADRYGRTVHTVSRWLASSKTCSDCGHRLDELPLQIRSWTCPKCRVVHDRDHNAAKTILAAGRAERRNAGGASVSPPTTREARGDEAGSTPTAA
ncbi:transposase [Mycobacterium paragordonae]|uniref:transposase n=1 Tax=Mycobacterium paragordonae TaxID=1389713 RepID=UPI001F5B50B0|nr:transposase [Mycobacterium paragordonae]